MNVSWDYQEIKSTRKTKDSSEIIPNRLKLVSLRNLAQNGKIHKIRYWRTLIFEFKFCKRSSNDLKKSDEEWNLNFFINMIAKLEFQ